MRQNFEKKCTFFCKTECIEGWYGMNCSQQCTKHCKDSKTCNHVTGHCEKGCAAGWTGPFCDKGICCARTDYFTKPFLLQFWITRQKMYIILITA